MKLFGDNYCELLVDAFSSVPQQGTEGTHTNTLMITSCLSPFMHGEFNGSLPKTVQTVTELTWEQEPCSFSVCLIHLLLLTTHAQAVVLHGK